MKSEITKAWCYELAEVITIERAHEYATSFTPPKKLKFTCRDEECRSGFEPLVVGANYLVDLVDNGRKRVRYFRVASDHPHRPGCPDILNAGRAASERPAAGDAMAQPDLPKASNVIDEFVVLAFDGTKASKTVSVANEVAKSPIEERGGGRGAAAGLTKTSNLDKLIEVRRLLQNSGKLDQEFVQINGHRWTYRQAFVGPRYFRPRLAGSAILLGNASFYCDRNRDCWVLKFCDELHCFEANNQSRCLVLELPVKRLVNSRMGLRHLQDLTQWRRESRAYLSVAAIGRIDAVPAGYALHLDSLLSLALRLKTSTSQSSANSSMVANSPTR